MENNEFELKETKVKGIFSVVNMKNNDTYFAVSYDLNELPNKLRNVHKYQMRGWEWFWNHPIEDFKVNVHDLMAVHFDFDLEGLKQEYIQYHQPNINLQKGIQPVKEKPVDFRKQIHDIIDNWDYQTLGKITQTKIYMEFGLPKNRVEKLYPEFKQKVNDLNENNRSKWK